MIGPDVFTGWIPVRFYWRDDGPYIDWCYAGKHDFTEISFSRDIQTLLRLPFNQVFRHQTPITELREWQTIKPGIKPTAFIFHASRSGAGLVTQMLTSFKQNIVISEARLIDSILRSHVKNDSVTDANRVEWLRWVISALGQKRKEQQRNLFVKFDSWNTIYLPLILRAFPDVPWIFLYRDPVEILVSHLKQRGIHMVPGMIEPSVFGFDDEVLRVAPEDYCARVLGSIYQAALAQSDRPNCTLINHNQLPHALVAFLTSSMDLSEEDNSKICARAEYDSIDPSREATSVIKQLSADLVGPAYLALESRRLSPLKSAQECVNS